MKDIICAFLCNMATYATLNSASILNWNEVDIPECVLDEVENKVNNGK